MFYDRFIQLCKERNVKPTPLIVELGLSSSNAAQWKKGSTPRPHVLQKIANYFDVPVSYFYETPEIEKSPAESGKRSAHIYDVSYACIGGDHGFTSDEVDLIADFRKLDQRSQMVVLNLIKSELQMQDKYADLFEQEVDSYIDNHISDILNEYSDKVDGIADSLK